MHLMNQEPIAHAHSCFKLGRSISLAGRFALLGSVYTADESSPGFHLYRLAEARVTEDPKQVLPIVEKINLKYLGTNERPLAQMLIENARRGDEVLIELTPKFFSARDFAKAQ
jgi:hypothetical protein